MRKSPSWLVVLVWVFLLGACVPQGSDLPGESSLCLDSAVGNPLLGCWRSPQDSTAGQLCIYEDSILFYDLLAAYPYCIRGDSLIVNGSDGDVFIRWRYLRQHDTLLLFQRSESGWEEYVVLMTFWTH